MMWWIYNSLFLVVFLALTPKFLLHMRRRGGYWPDFRQRFGIYRPEVRGRLAEGGRIWIHAVSVGEVFIAAKLMATLRGECPGTRFVLSVTTSTGHAVAGRLLDPADVLIYFPVDFPPITRRVLDLVRPSALAIVETELWPNLIRLAAARGLPVFLVNGRLSDSSYRGYRFLRPWSRAVLSHMTALYVQSEQDRQRYADIGAPDARLKMMGTAKYDVAQVDGEAHGQGLALLREAGIPGDAILLLGASTWPGEEEALLRVCRTLRARHPRLRLLLAPRHAERRAHVTRAVQEAGWTVVRRSDLQAGAHAGAPPDVLLLDTTGELRKLVACAQIVFVGKSLCSHGGQNPIEPAAYGKPTVTGPHMENFRSVMQDLQARDAIVTVADEEALCRETGRLLEDEDSRDALGRRARETVEAGRGALQRMVEDMKAHLSARAAGEPSAAGAPGKGASDA